MARFMDMYAAEVEPVAVAWLETDEGERIVLVEASHRGERIRVPNMRLHSTIHVVVENQVALGEVPVVEALARLRAEGLTRHDAVHAVGMVVADHLFDLLQSGPVTSADSNAAYRACVGRLRATEWLRFSELGATARARNRCREPDGSPASRGM